MQYNNFELEVAEGCARISLIGPGAPAMGDLCDEFVDLMLRLNEDRAARMLLFIDGDHAFDFHHNLDQLATAYEKNEGIGELAADEEISRRIVTLIQESTKPVIAATRGDIRNLGLCFYMAADVRLATQQATFTAPELSGGLIPGWGLTHTLPRVIGPGRALEFLWSRRTLTGQEAWQIGIVDRLIDDAVWEEELDRFAARVRGLPQPAVHLSKLGVQQAANLDMTTMLSYEWESQQQCWTSLETGEGLRAWQEGRQPRHDATLIDEED